MKRPARLAPAKDLSDPRVKHVRLDTRRLIETGVELSADVEWAGAVVWVRPEYGATAAQMQAVERQLLAAGAARVVVLPLPASDSAVPYDKVFRVTGDDRSARYVVVDLLKKVTEQKEEVERIVTKAMDEVGL